mmetsp:Transcript_14923/g.60867  ORF Transcript_14923/g.60867 Transcript_14923/m.60867 type:complete len:2078 (+) Transcript_14923:1860-8093(+)
MCLENTDLELKLRVFTVLRDLVGANSPNKAVCGEAGVIDLLIEDHVQWSGDRHLAAVVCAVIGRIAQYYITPETMYRLFNLVHSSKSFLPSLLLDAVESAISAGKPVAEFDLVGFRSGLLATNALTNFPPSKSGFSIVLWFRPNAINRKNILLTMFGSTGNSIEVSFCNGSFSYSEMSSKSREFADSSVTSTLPLSASEWTHVVITHSAPSMFGHSGEVDIFHNGKRLIRRSMKYPRFPSDTASVALGFSPATGSNNFNGQIASVAIVSDIIKLEHCQALTFLGHQFFPALSPTDNSLQRLLTLKTVPSMCNSLLEGKTLLTEKVILLFPAKAGDLEGCPDCSPASGSGQKALVTAKYVDQKSNKRLCTPRSPQAALEALGGAYVYLKVFLDLDRLAAADAMTDQTVPEPVLETCLNLFHRAVRRDELSMVDMKRFRSIELSSIFAANASAVHLTPQVAKAALNLLKGASLDEELSCAVAVSWIVNEIWLQAEAETAKIIYDFILDCFSSGASNEPHVTATRAAATNVEILRLIEGTRHSETRRILIAVIFEQAKARVSKKIPLKSAPSRELFGLVNSPLAADGKGLARDFIKVALDQTLVSPTTLAHLMVAAGGAAVKYIVSRFHDEDEDLRALAIQFAATACISTGDDDDADTFVAALNESIMARGINASSHQLLLQIAFGERGSGRRTQPFLEVTPLLFLLIANDSDLASRATGLRALVHELEQNDNIKQHVLGLPLWSKWVANIMEPIQSDVGEDSSAAAAIEDACSSLVSTIVLYVLVKGSLEDFCTMLIGFLSSGSPRFASHALIATITAVDKELVPVVLKGQKLHRDYKSQRYMEKVASVAIAIEMFAVRRSEDDVLEQTQPLLRIVQSLKMLGFWLHPQSTSDLPSKSPQMSSLVAPKPFDSIFNYDTMVKSGGFYRISLRMLCTLLARSESEEDWIRYSEMLRCALAPTGQPASPEIYVQYVRLCLESLSHVLSDVAPIRANVLPEYYNTLYRQWTEHRELHPPPKKSADNGGPPTQRAMALMEEERMRDDSIAKALRIREAEVDTENDNLAVKLVTIAAQNKNWVSEFVLESGEHVQKRAQIVEEQQRAKLLMFQGMWILVEASHALQEELQAAEVLHEPNYVERFWELDSYSDSFGRRWILRTNINGTSHPEADVSRTDARSEEDLLQLDTDSTGRDLVRVPVSASLLASDSGLVASHESDSEDERMADEDRLSFSGSETVGQTTPRLNSTATISLDTSTQSPTSSVHAHTQVQQPSRLLHSSPRLSTLDSDSFSGNTASESALIRLRCKRICVLGENSAELELSRTRIRFKPLDFELDEANEEYWSIAEREYQLADATELYSMRYLLQHVAFELHFQTQESIMVAFESQEERENFLKVLEGQLRRIEKHVKVYRSLKARKLAIRDATVKWRKRQMSNFQYLMIVNRLSGRTYNDAAQYPVYPWVLRDYNSDQLDLSNRNTFRNLSKPMGCQPSDEEVGVIGMSDREARFRERYDSWSDPDGIPPFHYGSHYSTTGIVVYYLVRLEPFASLFLQHQGGHFDYPERMFRSVGDAWSSSTSSTQNVSELVPELFYNPEFARNRNRLPLGTTQSGTVIGDVELPPWAHGSPEIFVKLHREALESEYVSEHLNNWIDLIFGFKQLGKAAVEECNVFYYLTYEGAVDLNSMDPRERAGLLDQIKYYGQTPLQLFTKLHAARDTLQGAASSKSDGFMTHAFNLELADTICSVGIAADLILVISSSRSLDLFRLTSNLDAKGVPIYALEGEGNKVSGDPGRRANRGRKIGAAHLAPFTPEWALCGCFTASSDGKWVVSGGHWDNSIRVQATADPSKPKQVIRRHRNVVSCLVLSSDNLFLVTGCRDSSVMLFKTHRYSDYDRLSVVEQPTFILRGHTYPVVCVAVNTEVGVVVSVSDRGICIIHSVRDGRVLRVLEKQTLVSRVLITAKAEIVFMSLKEQLIRVVTINDVEVATAPTSARPTAICATSDGQFIIDGNENGEVSIRSSWNLSTLFQYPRSSSAVSALNLSRDESIVVVGLSNGKLIIHTVDRQLLHTRSRIMGLLGPLSASYPF